MSAGNSRMALSVGSMFCGKFLLGEGWMYRLARHVGCRSCVRHCETSLPDASIASSGEDSCQNQRFWVFTFGPHSQCTPHPDVMLSTLLSQHILVFSRENVVLDSKTDNYRLRIVMLRVARTHSATKSNVYQP